MVFFALGIGVGAFLLGAAGTYFATRSGTPESSHNGAKLDATGTINNVIVTDFQDKVEIESREMMVMLAVICSIKVVEFLYFMYNQHVGNIKRKYDEKHRATTAAVINV